MTTFSALPPELIGKIFDYACPDAFACERRGWRHHGLWLGNLTRVGCVDRSFLEALKYVSTLRIDLHHRYRAQELFVGAPSFQAMDARFDAHVERWCDIATRRLRGVLKFADEGSVRHFNSAQTRMIVTCAASFPTLQDLWLADCNPWSLAVSMTEQLRAGRLRRLEKILLQTNPPTEANVYTELIKPAYRDLLMELPVDLAVDLLVAHLGTYRRILVHGYEYDVWEEVFYELLAKGADVHSRPILSEVQKAIGNYNGMWTDDGSASNLHRIFEALLARGVDPNMRGLHETTVLYSVLQELVSSMMRLVRLPDDESEWAQVVDAWRLERREPYLSSAMRIIDLLVRHGAYSRPGTMRHSRDEPIAWLPDWLRARPDCTAPIREALSRGDLAYSTCIYEPLDY